MVDAKSVPHMSATELLEHYGSGDLTPVEVHDAVRRIIEATEPTINALSSQDAAAAREAAEASARRWELGAPCGPIDGVPVSVKENLSRVGVPLRSGTAASVPVMPVRNAPPVERVLEAGGVIIGSTTMPDWGMLSSGVSSLHGVTRSPWNPQWTAGGSSAGAAAATAAGYSPLAIGTDIGGSIRLPGGWLGLVAHKPSAGRVPLDAPYLGRAAGPMTRSAADALLFMEVLSLPDRRDWTSLPPDRTDWRRAPADPSGLRIGLHLDAGCGEPPTPDVVRLIEAVAQLFVESGARVESLEPFIRQELLDGLDLFWRVRSWNDFRKLPPAQQGAVLPCIETWCRAGADVSGADLIDAYQGIMEIQSGTIAATEQFDYVISPVAPMAAFPAEQPMPFDDDERWMWHIGFTAPYNMSGQPAVTINCGFTDDGRPVGVQISGRRWDDVGVLQVALWYEQNRSSAAVPRWPIRDLASAP